MNEGDRVLVRVGGRWIEGTVKAVSVHSHTDKLIEAGVLVDGFESMGTIWKKAEDVKMGPVDVPW